MSQPTAACDSAKTNRLGQLQVTVINSVSSEASFDSPQALEQKRANALAAANVTTGYSVGQFNFSQQCSAGFVGGGGGGGGGGCQLYWDEAIYCYLNVVTPSPRNGPNEACGCP